jgi:type II secretory pathway component PulF
LVEFSYKAVNSSGGHITGSVEAVDRKSAVVNLAQKGHFVTEFFESAESEPISDTENVSLDFSQLFKFGTRKVTGKDILAFTGQLSAALRAGLPMLEALEIICQQQHKVTVRDILNDLIKGVSSGKSLSEAMAQHKNIFSSLYLSMIRVGETGGILDKTTGQLVEILTREEKIKTSMKNASMYPLLVLIVGLVSVVIIITWVLPNIISTISEGAAILPWPTRFLLAAGDFLKAYGFWFMAVLIVLGYLFGKWIKGPGRIHWDTFKLKIPILGHVLRAIAVGRFAKTLGALTKGGVEILESLKVVHGTLGNSLLESGVDNVIEKVKSGSSLAGPLGESGYFPPLLVQIVSIGEQTGRLDELLLGAGETFDEEADAAITKFMAIFPAILIVLLALVIGFIIMAILLPIMMMGIGTGVFS